MSIKYSLRRYFVGKNPNELSAVTISHGTLYEDEIIERILQRETHLSRETIVQILELFYKVVAKEVAEGYSVILPLIKIRPGISGVFNSETDRFHDSRHKIKVNISAGQLLTTMMKTATVTKIIASDPVPGVLLYHDSVTETDNRLITPGGPAILKGEKMRFNINNPSEGIYFIAADGAETRVDIIAENNQSTIIFLTPISLLKGKYSVEIRKGYGTKNVVIRKGFLDENLEVL